MTEEKVGSEFAKGDITPMIDCVFLLLIFFMVATKFRQEETTYGFFLRPVKQGGELQSRFEPVLIEVKSGGDVLLNRGVISLDSLGRELRDLMRPRLDSEKSVKIDGRTANYGNVMKVLEVCSESSVGNISFELKEK